MLTRIHTHILCLALLNQCPGLMRVEPARSQTPEGPPCTLVPNIKNDVFVPTQNQSQALEGYLGQRMRMNIEKRLLRLDLDSILQPFEQRPGQQAWVGEHVGKWLHAACLSWRMTGDDRLKAKMDRTVKRLIATQLPNGYLGTYIPKNYWTRWDVWSHKYNLIGLLNYYQVTGDEAAMDACRRIGDLLIKTFGTKPGQLDIVHRTHSTHVGMAAGSVMEPMVMLYRYTGEKAYLEFCQYILSAWEQEHGPKIISSLLDKNGNVFRTANNKAYEMMSCLVGCLELYRVTGNDKLLEAARLAWQDIFEKRSYIIGSSSWSEHFKDDHDLDAGGRFHGQKYCSGSEGCVTVTWLQLTWHLLRLTGQAQYASELERITYNALLAAQSPHTGQITYFLPLIGDRKRYGEVTHGILPDVCCCSSSIPRGIAMIPDYTAGTFGDQLVLLLYKPGTYTFKINGQSVTLKVETDYPKNGTVTVTVHPQRKQAFPLALHVPAWCEDYQALVGNQTYQGQSAKLLTIDRIWQEGDRVKIRMAMPIRVLAGGKSYPEKMALKRGPQVLATDTTVRDNGGKLPGGWFGGQLYKIKGVTDKGTERSLSMVPFAEAGQARGDYDVWIDKLIIHDNVNQLDPLGKKHIPIGIPNSLDSLKTFVEAEGNFSPGIGTYGIYFWVFDPEKARLFAPTFEDVPCSHGLAEERLLIPWSQWRAGAVKVKTEVCEVKQKHALGDVYLTGARALLTNTGTSSKNISLYVALRPLGAAGYDVSRLAVSAQGDALLVEGHPAVIADTQATTSGVLPTDTIGHLALRGDMPSSKTAVSPEDDCSGALRFDVTIPPGQTETISLICPVHAGQRAVRHRWVPRPKNYIDSAVPKSDADGIDIPDLGLDAYRKMSSENLFEQARDDWSRFYSRVSLDLPDDRWTNGFYTMLGHAGLCMNEGAADVAVLNYTVFNRDGMYIANMMQKAGLPKLSESVIDYFLAHPFNGRPFPEADNPGQILWSIGQHWRFTRDREWLQRIYPSVKKLGAMIRYYRTPPGPYWVNLNSLDFGEALPEDDRMELKPGRCDGYHPEYTEAFDVVGLRVVRELSYALGESEETRQYCAQAHQLFKEYDKRFRKDLGKGYGSYSVLWPCRLYPLNRGKAHDQFKGIGKCDLVTWRYFAPATAHQGLLAGNRKAGYETVDLHLDHHQMRNWFTFDEGGKSGSGGWHHLRTTWTHSKTEPDGNHAVAMPHGWAIAEVWLLMRDSLVYERGDTLVLLAGVSPNWFKVEKGMAVKNLPTGFGKLDMIWTRTELGAVLELGDRAQPAGGFVLKLPETLSARVLVGGQTIDRDGSGGYRLQAGTKTVQIRF